jgi:hypothetical protein
LPFTFRLPAVYRLAALRLPSGCLQPLIAGLTRNLPNRWRYPLAIKKVEKQCKSFREFILFPSFLFIFAPYYTTSLNRIGKNMFADAVEIDEIVAPCAYSNEEAEQRIIQATHDADSGIGCLPNAEFQSIVRSWYK